MKDFFKDYVKMICEADDYDADEKLVNNIVDAICADDEIWDMVDGHIRYWLDNPDELTNEESEE